MATGTVLLPILGFTPDDIAPPAVSFTNNRPKLLFSASATEEVYISFRMPSDYASGPALKLQYTMASATSGGVALACEVMAVSDGDAADVDTESFDAVNTGTATVPGTAGYLDEISVTLTNADSVAAGDYVVLKVYRDHDHASDDAAGDLELIAVSVEYTTS